MRQLFLDRGILAVKVVGQPLLHENAVLVQVYYSFVSAGTEAATISHASESLFTQLPEKFKKVTDTLKTIGYLGTKALIKNKLSGTIQSLGYSVSGRVIACGSQVKKYRVGDFVACAGAGFAQHADIVAVPENLVVHITDEKYLRAASITTIGAIALQGVRRADLRLSETVVVMGLGLLGQLTVQLAKLSGCRVIGVDLLPSRLELARSLGADHVYESTGQLQKEIDFVTSHHGADATIITAASSSNALVQQAMEITRKKGKVVVVGDVGLKLERSPFYQKEIDFLISCSYGPGRYDGSYELEGKDYPYSYVRWTENRNMQAFVALLEQEKIKIDPLAQEVTLEDAQQGYEAINQKKTLGIIIAYDQKDAKPVSHESVTTQEKTFFPAVAGPVRLGIIGAGGFCKGTLLPIISTLKNISLNAFVESDTAGALTTARAYGAATVLTHDQELFAQDLVDAVVIATPHKFHTEQLLRALRNGKAVFAEKPAATSFEQLAQLRSFVELNPQAPLCVDYNRPFSPFMQKIKNEVVKRSSPLMVHYRVNAGYIAQDHWIQTELGCGQIIGQACHMFDLFCFLTDAKPISISVDSIRPKRDDLFLTDNFSAQVVFEDGSLCQLLFTALGHAELGKERMELFYDAKTIAMDDYRQLQGFGLSRSFNEKAMIADKGHKVLITQFFDAVAHQKKMPISFDRLFMAEELTLLAHELAIAGGGERKISV